VVRGATLAFADEQIEVIMPTKRMSAKRFCCECLEVFDEVYKTGCTYHITRNGRGLIRVIRFEPLIPTKDRKGEWTNQLEKKTGRENHAPN
jgi:hypothetical protein